MTTKERSALIRKVERRTRAKYIRRCILCFLLALIIGVAGGIYLCKWGPLKDFADTTRSADLPVVTPAPEEPVETAQPEETETAVTAVTSAPEETPVPAAVVTVVPVETAAPETTPESEAAAEATPAVIVATEVTQDPATEQAADAVDAATTEEGAPEIEAEGETGMLDAQEAAAAMTLGTLENPVPLGEVYSFETEVVQGGTPRYAVSMAEYDTLTMTASVTDYLTPDYFAEKYSTKYKLQGNEAGAALSLNFAETTGVEEINPQEALLVNFESEDGTTSQGYQLMNAEIAGDYGVPLKVGDEKTYYKRFAFTTDPEMDYLTLTYYVGGQAVKVYFSLEEPVVEPEETPVPETEGDAVEETPAPEATVTTYVTIENGSRGDHVKRLQERLIELGYLDDTADGIAGGNTASAVSAAQTKAGMTVNGIADAAFQEYIFSENAQKAGN